VGSEPFDSGRACGRGHKAPDLFSALHDDTMPRVLHAPA